MDKDIKLNRSIDDKIVSVVQSYLRTSAFTDRKITDTPTDALSVVNRRFITNNGTIRPTSSIIGQPFLDMTLAAGRGKPIFWNGTGWIDATGTYV